MAWLTCPRGERQFFLSASALTILRKVLPPPNPSRLCSLETLIQDVCTLAWSIAIKIGCPGEGQISAPSQSEFISNTWQHCHTHAEFSMRHTTKLLPLRCYKVHIFARQVRESRRAVCRLHSPSSKAQRNNVEKFSQVSSLFTGLVTARNQ